VFTLLRGPWTITCDKCGTRFQLQLTVEGVENLVRYGEIVAECVNPNCIDWFWRHKIRITLRDLISAYIMR